MTQQISENLAYHIAQIEHVRQAFNPNGKPWDAHRDAEKLYKIFVDRTYSLDRTKQNKRNDIRIVVQNRYKAIDEIAAIAGIKDAHLVGAVEQVS